MDPLEWIEGSTQRVCPPLRMKRKIRSKRFEFVGWGSRPLVEFLESIGKDISEKISRHDVTSIINEYVSINNLLHPSKKKRILCDERLHSIFGRKTIGRIKIHDMLEPHYADNQDVSDGDFTCSSDEIENSSTTLKRENGVIPETKYYQKTRVQVNPKCYFAAMVPGNINLVYLRKTVVEDLLNDPETFEGKISGSFVRIKSDPHDYLQKNTHQLVQVIGVKKISISSDTRTKFLLHLSNVVKDIDICMLSDEKFTEEECKDLDLRVKHGLLKRLTVGEVQQKAQYLEKKQLLQTADEQLRLLHEIPQVVVDETESKAVYVDANKGDGIANQGYGIEVTNKLQMRKEFLKDTNQVDIISPSSTSGESSKFGLYFAENKTAALMPDVRESAENKTAALMPDVKESAAESRQSVHDEQPQQPIESTCSSNNGTKLINEVEKGSQQLVNARIVESRVINLSDDDEPRAEERDPTNQQGSLIWNYLDPQGDVQGPFSLTSLKNWKDADYFPSDFKVWKAGQNLNEAVLLNDILSLDFSN